MPNPEKVAVVEEIRGKLDSAKIAILTNFQGLNVAEMTELRKLFRGAGVDYKVYKNTLTRLAVQQNGIEESINSYLDGPTALAFSKSDNFAALSKIVRDFSARHQNFKVKAGILGKKVIVPDDVLALANLPPKEVLIAMVLGGIQAPVSKLMGVLQGPIRSFMSVLKSLAEQKGRVGGESVPEQQTGENQ